MMPRKPILLVFVVTMVFQLLACSQIQESNIKKSPAIPAATDAPKNDGGESVVSAVEVTAANVLETDTEPILAFIKKVLYPKDEWKSLEPDLRRYEAADFDLNEDGVSEILLTLPTSDWCGSGGCTLWVLDPKGALISKTTVVDFPIGISSEKTNGWFDLFTLSNREHHVLKYGKKGYSSNASMAEVIEEGTRKSGTKKEMLANPFDNYSSF